MGAQGALDERVRILVYAYLPRDINLIEKVMNVAKEYAGYIVELKKFGMQELVGVAVDTRKSKAKTIANEIAEKMKEIGARDIIIDILPSLCLV